MGSLQKDFQRGRTWGHRYGEDKARGGDLNQPNLAQGHQPEDLPNPHCDGHVGKPVESVCQKDSGFAFLAYWNDMLAGAACCQLTDNNGLYLRFIGTLNRHRRKGVAKKLMQKVLEEAKERDVHNIISYVRNDNKAAIHINQKFGFGITSNDKRDPSLYVMEKMLHNNNPVPPSA